MNQPVYPDLNSIADNRFWWRLLLTSVAGIIVAGGLTLFMHALIEFSQHELDNSAKANFLDFVRVKRDETSRRKNVKPQRPETREAPPAPPAPQSEQQSSADASLAVSVPSVSNSIDVDIGGIGIGSGDGEYLPIVKVAPAYPMKAASLGIEGNCMVEYTVTTSGTTRDVSIVEGMCPAVFARASVKAAKKFKYKPRVVGGEAIEVPNVRNRFDYTLEKPEENQ